MQTGPLLTALKNPIPGQSGDNSEHSDPSPEPVPPNQDQIADKPSADTSNPPAAHAAKPSGADDNDPEETAEISAALQDAASDISSSTTPTPTSSSKDAAAAQPQSKAPNASQLNTLMQSLQPATHRQTSAPAPQAQSSSPQSDANTAVQPAQTGDSGNSSTGHSHGEQARNSDNSASPQSAQPPTGSADTAVAAPPSPTSTSGTAANLAANNTGGISAVVGAQGSSTIASGATLQVGPAAQTNAPAGQPDLNALALSIAAKSQAGAKQFDISLQPAELGRVEVRLTVDGSGNAQAHLVAERPETLQMLQRDSGTLTHALKESGVQLSDNGLQFSLKGQERQGDGAQQGAQRARPLALSAVSSNDGPVSSTYGLSLSQAGIDIRV